MGGGRGSDWLSTSFIYNCFLSIFASDQHSGFNALILTCNIKKVGFQSQPEKTQRFNISAIQFNLLWVTLLGQTHRKPFSGDEKWRADRGYTWKTVTAHKAEWRDTKEGVVTPSQMKKGFPGEAAYFTGGSEDCRSASVSEKALILGY